MASTDRVIDIQKTPRTENNWRLVTKELEERGKALHRMVSYLVAKESHEMVLTGIPNGQEYKELRESLQLVEVGVGGKDGQSAFAIYAPTRGRRVRKIDVPKTVIYVRAKKRLTRADPDVQLLEDNGPWTADTIPFWPNKKEAVVVQRKVSKREADKIAKAQKGKLPKLISRLREMGRKVKKKRPGEPGQVKRGSKPIPDVAMQAIELEFGAEGKRAKPVFRKMIREAELNVKRLPKKHPIIMKTMTDPNMKRYKRFPPRMTKISTSKASTFKGFQKRLR